MSFFPAHIDYHGCPFQRNSHPRAKVIGEEGPRTSYLSLHNKCHPPQNLAASKRKHFLSHGFQGSGIQVAPLGICLRAPPAIKAVIKGQLKLKVQHGKKSSSLTWLLTRHTEC